jgi:hypothetical protein
MRGIGVPPAIGHDMAVAYQDEAMDAEVALLKRIDKGVDGGGSNALGLWHTARQLAGMSHRM